MSPPHSFPICVFTLTHSELGTQQPVIIANHPCVSAPHMCVSLSWLPGWAYWLGLACQLFQILCCDQPAPLALSTLQSHHNCQFPPLLCEWQSYPGNCLGIIGMTQSHHWYPCLFPVKSVQFTHFIFWVSATAMTYILFQQYSIFLFWINRKNKSPVMSRGGYIESNECCWECVSMISDGNCIRGAVCIYLA